MEHFLPHSLTCFTRVAGRGGARRAALNCSVEEQAGDLMASLPAELIVDQLSLFSRRRQAEVANVLASTRSQALTQLTARCGRSRELARGSYYKRGPQFPSWSVCTAACRCAFSWHCWSSHCLRSPLCGRRGAAQVLRKRASASPALLEIKWNRVEHLHYAGMRLARPPSFPSIRFAVLCCGVHLFSPAPG